MPGVYCPPKMLRQVTFTFTNSAVYCDRVPGRWPCGVSNPRASSCTPSHISTILFSPENSPEPSHSGQSSSISARRVILYYGSFHSIVSCCESLATDSSILGVPCSMNFRKSCSRVYRELRFHFQRLYIRTTNFRSSRHVRRAR